VAEPEDDVLIASHRWPALTHAFVGEVHARGRTVLGVFDREEPAARAHLVGVGVDQVIESDRGPDAVVELLVELHSRQVTAPIAAMQPGGPTRRGRVVVVGGPAGVGRTEIAVHLAANGGAVLVDADDVSPGVAPRLGLPIEPNLRTAIDAVEHGRGDARAALVAVSDPRCSILAGLPSANGWSHVRVGEVMRVVEDLATESSAVVVVDSGGPIEDVGGSPRGRYAVARALLLEADAIVAVCAATPVGITRFLSWIVEVRRLAPFVPIVVAVNRAPSSRFRRGEIYEELTRSLPPFLIEFVADDRRVTEAAWDGRFARTGPFTRAVARLGAAALAVARATDFRDEVDGVIEALERAS
jgi:MinD-like ATPase involved in chromosome partitioning or flagellar assembly